MENDDENLGDCCICGEQNESVRNIITLDKRIPADEKRGGWGCVTCGLEPFGAVAVLCDDCVYKYVIKRTEIKEVKFACLGFPGENRRIEVGSLTEEWKHIAAKHPEVWAKNN